MISMASCLIFAHFTLLAVWWFLLTPFSNPVPADKNVRALRGERSRLMALGKTPKQRECGTKWALNKTEEGA